MVRSRTPDNTAGRALFCSWMANCVTVRRSAEVRHAVRYCGRLLQRIGVPSSTQTSSRQQFDGGAAGG